MQQIQFFLKSVPKFVPNSEAHVNGYFLLIYLKRCMSHHYKSPFLTAALLLAAFPSNILQLNTFHLWSSQFVLQYLAYIFLNTCFSFFILWYSHAHWQLAGFVAQYHASNVNFGWYFSLGLCTQMTADPHFILYMSSPLLKRPLIWSVSSTL